MANANVNKVIYDGNTLIDLTGDTIAASDVINSKTFHDASGASVIGTCSYDADTSDANVTASEILKDKTAYKAGQKVTGTMPNRGSVSTDISTVSQQVTIQNGYHDGSGKVKIDSTEQAKIIATNIKSGVQILGVIGTYAGESQPTQTKSFIPTASGGTVLPDSGYLLSQVTVAAVPYVEADNSSGGKTVTIL